MTKSNDSLSLSSITDNTDFLRSSAGVAVATPKELKITVQISIRVINKYIGWNEANYKRDHQLARWEKKPMVDKLTAV